MAAPTSMTVRRRAALAFLLVPPMAWLVLAYLGSLAVLLVSAFWERNSFTGAVVHEFTGKNVIRVLTDELFRAVTLRTLGVALLVTVLCMVLAVPLALYMAKVASPRARLMLVVAVTTPLWASYLVKAYAWRMLLSPEGPLAWGTGYSPGYGLTATIITLTYLWLPYMVLPVFAGIDGMRGSYVDAAADLGARPWTAFRTVMVPLLGPAVAAGSVFTFSLSLGDYITVQLVGGTNQMLGNIVYSNFSTDLPFAAAVALLPLLVMGAYLLTIRRTGALERL